MTHTQKVALQWRVLCSLKNITQGKLSLSKQLKASVHEVQRALDGLMRADPILIEQTGMKFNLTMSGQAEYLSACQNSVLRVNSHEWLLEVLQGAKIKNGRWVPTEVENAVVSTGGAHSVNFKERSGELAFLAKRTGRTLKEIYSLVTKMQVSICPLCEVAWISDRRIEQREICKDCL